MSLRGGSRSGSAGRARLTGHVDDTSLIVRGPHTWENWRKAPVIENRGQYFAQVRHAIRLMAIEQWVRDLASLRARISYVNNDDLLRVQMQSMGLARADADRVLALAAAPFLPVEVGP